MAARRHDTDTDAEADGPITRDQIRARLQEITGEADDLATEFRSKAIAAGAVVTALIVVVVFLIGRRRGKKATTVVEIIRV